jgi:hypothetical protein
MKHTTFLAGLLLAAATALPVFSVYAEAAPNRPATQTVPGAAGFVVYKNPQCGCCGRWIEHMKDSGFEVQVKDQADLAGLKRNYGIPPSQQSCHTAVWSDGLKNYVFEGHVPATVIRQFLKAAPKDARGLLVPGMPVGSPGMEYGNEQVAYDVLLLRKNGTTEVFARIGPE